MTLSPTQIHGQLDTKGLLDDAHGPGAYSLRVTTPDSVEGVARAWLSEVDAALPEGAFERLSAENVAYVGGSKDVYARLQDHGKAKVRRATFLRVFEPVEVLNVWASETPFREERKRARELSRGKWTVWSDGELY